MTAELRTEDKVCKVTGAFNIFAEIIAYLYTVWFSYLVKKMVTSPTSNFSKLSLIAHITSLLGALLGLLIISLTYGFGLTVSLYSFNLVLM